MNELTLYAGYGPNRERSMIEAITGETARLIGSGVILNVGLWVQSVRQAPDEPIEEGGLSPCQILTGNYGENGQSFGLRDVDGGIVAANLFEVSAQGIVLIRNWEMVGHWKEQQDVKFRLRGGGSKEDDAVAEFLPTNQRALGRVSGMVYHTFLNDQGDMHLYANATRQEYLREHGLN